MIYDGSYEEESNNGFNDYFEETTLFVFAVTANYLFGYSEFPGTFLVAGVGAGAFSVEWEESSPTDTSLGTPLPGFIASAPGETSSVVPTLTASAALRF